MDHRPQGRAVGEAEGKNVLGMGVHHRHHIGTRLEDAAMNETLEIERTLFLSDRLAVECELHDVGAGNEFRRERAREKET